ncbi:MAG: hypothetical protein ACYDGN_09395 [Acidimicrobiales bacterium]
MTAISEHPTAEAPSARGCLVLLAVALLTHPELRAISWSIDDDLGQAEIRVPSYGRSYPGWSIILLTLALVVFRTR